MRCVVCLTFFLFFVVVVVVVVVLLLFFSSSFVVLPRYCLKLMDGRMDETRVCA